MLIKKTCEIEVHIRSVYEKLRPEMEKERIFKPIVTHFAETTPRNEPGAFCYSDKEYYYYCTIGDRGALTIEKTSSLLEITYWVLKFQISVMAFDYAKKHEVEGQSQRQTAYAKYLELMGIIGDDYRVKAEIEIKEILKEHPFLPYKNTEATP
jgi:hypothetical protein